MCSESVRVKKIAMVGPYGCHRVCFNFPQNRKDAASSDLGEHKTLHNQYLSCQRHIVCTAYFDTAICLPQSSYTQKLHGNGKSQQRATGIRTGLTETALSPIRHDLTPQLMNILATIIPKITSAYWPHRSVCTLAPTSLVLI